MRKKNFNRMTEKLTAIIIESINKARNKKILFDEIYSAPDIITKKNEFLFFIKPEITSGPECIRLEKIVKHILDKIEAYNFSIHNILSLSAPYIKQYNIIAKHYGVINQIASDAVGHLSESAKEKFKELYGKPVEEVDAYGGIEFIEKHGHYDAYSLSDLWRNLEHKKLGGGTYCAPVDTEEGIIYIFNGFHPRQIDHFTRDGSNIVVFTLSADIPWTVARNDFIGATNPQKAKESSLRRDFLEKIDEFGLAEVSDSFNGVHLSAGPVEALVELQRFNSNYTVPSGIREYSDFNFGKALMVNLESRFEEIINNTANVDIDGKHTSIFDLTEEKDSDEAIELLRKYLSPTEKDFDLP